MTPPIDQEEEAKDRGFLEEAPAHPRWVGTWRACSSPPAKTSCSAGSSATVCQARSSASCARGFRKASTVAPRTSCRLCEGGVSRPPASAASGIEPSTGELLGTPYRRSSQNLPSTSLGQSTA